MGKTIKVIIQEGVELPDLKTLTPEQREAMLKKGLGRLNRGTPPPRASEQKPQ